MNKSSVGSLFFALLGLVFITLKLTNFIDWSWWWVLAPLYLPFAIGIGLLFVMCAITGLVTVLCSKKK